MYDALDLLDLEAADTLYTVVTGDDPAAGAECSIRVPAGEIWELRSFLVNLTTDIAAATRVPVLVLSDGNTDFLRVPTVLTVTASQTRQTCWTPHGWGIASSDANIAVVPLINAPILLPGWQVRTVTTALQAGDNYTAPVALVRRVTQRGLASELAAQLAGLLGYGEAADRAAARLG